MAQSMLSIKQRLNTVASIRKITNAMKLIAASRLVRLQGNLRGAKHYQAGMDACLQACLASVDFAKNPATPSCMRINESERDLYIVVTSFIGAFKEYTSIVGLFNGPGTTNGSYNMYTIVYYIYNNLSSHTSYAAAAAVFLFVVILVFTGIQLVVSKKRVYY